MKISIITVCYNSEKTINDTIASVLNQTYQNYEYIIIDGLSKDKTMEIVKKYEPKFNGKLKYISEKDNGLYDAMNKGIKMASGDIVGIINSDDVLANANVFQTIIDNFTSDIDYLYSDVLYCNEDFSKVERKFKSTSMESKILCIAHPTLYLRKKIFDEIGYYNQDFRISADYDFTLRLSKGNYKYLHLKDTYFVLMRIGGVSSAGLKGYLKNFKDSKMVLNHNNIRFAGLITFIRSIKTLIEIIKGKIL